MSWGKKMAEAQRQRDAKITNDRDWTKYQANSIEGKT
jgi:hypothetical protein